MKRASYFFAILLLASAGFAQTDDITADEYEQAFRKAVSETNSRFPFIHTFISEIFENGELVSKTIHIAERQSAGFERQTFTSTENGISSTSFQLRVGFGDNVYCSSDGRFWTGPQKYECPRSVRVYGPRNAHSVSYSLQAKTVDGRKISEYRKLEVFQSKDGTSTFAEDIALIGEDGLFVSTVKSMSDLPKKQVTTKLTNKWELNAKILPITAPENVVAPSGEAGSGTKLTIKRN